MLIELDAVDKTYPVGDRPFHALRDVSLAIDQGELIVVTGKSGSGKSTLLNLVAGLDRPTAGRVTVAGQPVNALSEDALARFRGESVGVVFQFFQLLPTLTVAENVMIAMDFAGRIPASERAQRSATLLERVGVSDQADKLPSALSGGQQQRVAIARALANDPPLIVADEPTGNLDSRTAADVMQLLDELRKGGKTVLCVTHDPELAVAPVRRLTLHDGRIVRCDP